MPKVGRQAKIQPKTAPKVSSAPAQTPTGSPKAARGTAGDKRGASFIRTERTDALTEGIERYLVDVQLEKGLSAHTQESYGSDLEQFGLYAKAKGLADWKSLTMSEVAGYLAALAGRELQTSSVARKITALRTFLRFLYKDGTLKEDLAERVSVPKLRRKLPETMSVMQFEQLLKVIPESTPAGQRDRAIVEMLYGCGLRISELTTLRITDVSDNFDFIRAYGKGGKERMIPMGSKAAEALKRYLTQGRPQLVRAKTTGVIFISRLGSAISRKTVWVALKTYARKAKIPVVLKPHLLRHSFATELLKGGADLRMIQEMLGHADIATTQIYTNVETTGLVAIHEQSHPRAHLDVANKVMKLNTEPPKEPPAGK